MATAAATTPREKTKTDPKPQGTGAADMKPVNLPATQNVRSVLFTMSERFGMEPAAFEATLRHTVIPKDCSREQFAAFLLVAKEYDLNPLLKEIYAFPAKGGGIQPIVGIDGWSNLINSHPSFDGMAFTDRTDAGGNLIAITCEIFRKDRAHSISATEYMAECKRETEPWKKWPRRMLRHKAMIQAARYAFGFAGIVDPDEADRFAAETARDVTPRRMASTTQAFDEFAQTGADQPAGDTSGAQGDNAAGDDMGDFDDADQAGDQTGAEQKPGDDKPKAAEPAKEAKKDAPAWPADRVPKNADEYIEFVTARMAAWTKDTTTTLPDDSKAKGAEAIAVWFKSKEQRDARTTAGVIREDFDKAKLICASRINELNAAV